MKKNGFTLIELLSIIVIIGVISLISVPIINNVLSNSKDKMYTTQVDILVEAGRKWGMENTSVLPEIGSDKVVCLSISDLKSGEYIESDLIKDPRNRNRYLTGKIVIRYVTSYNQYTYEYMDTSDEYDVLCK